MEILTSINNEVDRLHIKFEHPVKPASAYVTLKLIVLEKIRNHNTSESPIVVNLEEYSHKMEDWCAAASQLDSETPRAKIEIGNCGNVLVHMAYNPVPVSSESVETSEDVDSSRDYSTQFRNLGGGDEVNASPVYLLKQALLRDRDYLLGWHANIACAVTDAACRHPQSNWDHGQEAARQFLGVLFADDDEKPVMISNEEVRNGIRDD